MSKINNDIRRWLVGLAGIPMILGAAAISGSPLSSSHAMSLRPTVHPLPTIVATTVPITSNTPVPTNNTKGLRLGAHIRLLPSSNSQLMGLHAAVQWQGHDGQWYIVEGWQSVLDGNMIEWWVAPADFGKGPFRWAIYRNHPQETIRLSESFYLPRENDACLDVGSLGM